MVSLGSTDQAAETGARTASATIHALGRARGHAPAAADRCEHGGQDEQHEQRGPTGLWADTQQLRNGARAANEEEDRCREHDLRRAEEGKTAEGTGHGDPSIARCPLDADRMTAMAAAGTARRSAPVRVLFVHHRSELGGAPTSLSYLIRELDRSRFAPHVFCPPGPAAQMFGAAGAEVHLGSVAAFTHIWASTYHGRRWLLFARETSRLIPHLLEFGRVLRSHDFRLVHVNDSPLVAAALVARQAGIPVVWHLRSALPGDDTRSRALRAIIARTSTASIAISEDIATSFAVDSVVIPNAVDLEKFRPGDAAAARAKLGFPADELVIAYFGFIYPSKGFRDFIEAAALLRARGVHAHYLIVGGPVRGEDFFTTRIGRIVRALDLARNYDLEARQIVANLALEDSVRFVSFTPETAQLYQASDVVVSPSRGPEMGRPVIEGSACGRAIVASGSLSGAGILVPGETGLLVPQRSPDILAAALDQLTRDEPLRLRLGANGRRYAEKTFNARRNAERVMQVYEEALAIG